MRNQTVRRIAIGAALLLSAAAASLRAADDLPKAETLLDKYIEATGGKAAYEKNRNQMVTGTMEFASMGMKGTITAYRAAPDKSYAEINLGGVGKIQEGSNGTVAWSLSAMQGPHVKEGEEKISALQLARYDAEMNWRDVYKSVLQGHADAKGRQPLDPVLRQAVGSDRQDGDDREKSDGGRGRGVAAFRLPQRGRHPDCAQDDAEDHGPGVHHDDR